MAIRDYLARMRAVRDDIHEIKAHAPRPNLATAMRDFRARTGYAGKLLFAEPQLIVLALLQWIVIALGYFLWVQMFDWIPEPVWEQAANSDSALIVNIILLLWSLACVGLVGFPLGVLSACMGAIHFLHRQGQDTRVAHCLKLVLPNAWSIWVFSWVDGWWTVSRIADRLPKSEGWGTWAEQATREAIYQAWKMGTMGMLPAMVTGNGLVESGRQSVRFVTASFSDVAILRLGYSALCWIVGITTYVGTIMFLATSPGSFSFEHELAGSIYQFYFWAGVPLVIAVGVIMLAMRPIYLLSAFDLYSDHLERIGESITLAPPPSKGASALIAVLLLALLVLVVFLYRDALGITELLATTH